MAGTFQVKEVGGVRDTEIECSDPTLGGSHEPYAVAFDKMRRSVFCLVLPGDAQSTRRLSEIFLAGCVPVFIGPPTTNNAGSLLTGAQCLWKRHLPLHTGVAVPGNTDE